MQQSKQNALLIIDGQHDFCAPNGALYVPGADGDMKRLANWIQTHGTVLDLIACTFDNHSIHSIFHPSWFVNEEGNNPPPFTQITAVEAKSGTWIPNFYPEETYAYLEALETQSEYLHTIWPFHCITGSLGAALYTPLYEVIKSWAIAGGNYLPIIKGTNILTEHYGVFVAEVPLENAPETQINFGLLNILAEYENIYLAGEASSHCVARSLAQVMQLAPALAQKFIILADCMSPVPGFEEVATPVFAEAREQEIRFSNTTLPI